MDKFFSFVDFLNSEGPSNRTTTAEKLLDEIYLDLFLNGLQHIQQEQFILELIDVALDEKDEATFYRLTDQLKELQQIEEQ